MRYRKLIGDDDYSFGNGLSDFLIDTPDAVAQNVKTRLLLWLGEWYLDTSDGTPYLDGVMGKRLKDEADRTIRARILGTDNVAGIASYESTLDPDSRGLNILVTIDTLFGPSTVDVRNQINY